jgi:NTE family protein
MTSPITPRFEPGSPVESGPPTDRETRPEVGTALCLSGGGYRAMLFHLGALWRLQELGQLSRLQRVSSVSGGSIVAARLALKWQAVSAGGVPIFKKEVVQPIRHLASQTIDASSVIGGVLLPGTVSDRIAGQYRKYLFGDATLQDLPSDGEGPRFVINASNVQSGALWRFMKPYMRDWRVGEVKAPTIPLATAVAASAAFPPVLSPCVLRLNPKDFTPGLREELGRSEFRSSVVLTDGGVYDNLGLETAWKRYRTILVSNGGGQMAAEARTPRDWFRHTKRVLDLVDNQVRALRQRQVIAAYERPRENPTDSSWRDGAYWGIRTSIADYRLSDSLPCPPQLTSALSNTPTRLKAIPELLQERITNWGYAVCDAALRSFGGVKQGPPPAFPYATAGVG